MPGYLRARCRQQSRAERRRTALATPPCARSTQAGADCPAPRHTVAAAFDGNVHRGEEAPRLMCSTHLAPLPVGATRRHFGTRKETQNTAHRPNHLHTRTCGARRPAALPAAACTSNMIAPVAAGAMHAYGAVHAAVAAAALNSAPLHPKKITRHTPPSDHLTRTHLQDQAPS